MKLCPCQKTKIRLALSAKIKEESHLAFESLILAALEDGCMCDMKRETALLTKLMEAEEATNKRLVKAVRDAEELIKSLEEKKHQSPCEHKGIKRVLMSGRYFDEKGWLAAEPSTFHLFLCGDKDGCGLVTCKNPNE